MRSDYFLLPVQGHTCVNQAYPFKPSRCIKASFYISEIGLNFPTTKGFRMNISMKLVYQLMEIFFTFSPTSNRLYPLEVENCDSNSWLVVDEDDNVKSSLKGTFQGAFELENIERYSKVFLNRNVQKCASIVKWRDARNILTASLQISTSISNITRK